MIFATVGSMFPFDRLVRAVDDWAAEHPGEEVFLQIGNGAYEPRYAPFARIVPMAEYRKRLASCDLMVAHVGTGSILQALELGKQQLLLPRLAALGEHTSDHQLHTAVRVRHVKGLIIARDIDDLQSEITKMLAAPIAVGTDVSDRASPELLANVSAFLSRAFASRKA